MAETRRIENYGVLKFLSAERGARDLLVVTDVIQLPYQEYTNVKSNPPKSHYGYACFMAKDYVLYMVDIQFRRQVLVDRNRHLIQLAWQEFCNSKVIAAAVGIPLPATTVEYPVWQCDEIRFKLEPGVILNVYKSHFSPTTCAGVGIVEPVTQPTAPGLPASPSLPPPKGTPEANKLPLSPPYEGANDNGNTYVRPADPTPPSTSPGPDCTKTYAWNWTVVGTRSNGTTQTFTGSSSSQGEITGFEQFFNSSFNSWAYRYIRKDCSGNITRPNMFGSTEFTSISGSVSNFRQV